MKISFYRLLFCVINIIIILCFNIVKSNGVSAALDREFALLDPHNAALTYRTVLFKDSDTSVWKSVCHTSGLSSVTLEAMCKIVGYTRVTSSAYIMGTSNNPSFPGGMTVGSCSLTTNGAMHSANDQCTFYTAGYLATCLPLQLYCAGIRNGGDKGVWADPLYVRMNYNNLVEVREAFTAVWRPLCGASTGTYTASSICSMLDSGTVARTGSYTYLTVPAVSDFFAYQVICPAAARNFSACSYNRNSFLSYYCSTSYGLGVYCSQASAGITSGSYKFRYAYSSYNYIEVLPSSSSATDWGRICNSGFSATDSAFFCELFGFPSDDASYTSSSAGTSTYYNPFILTSVACSPSYTSFSQCGYSTSVSTCSGLASKTVQLSCPYPIIQPGSAPITSGAYQLRILDSNSQIQVRASGTTSWRLLCDDGMTFESSTAIGRWMGKGPESYCAWTNVAGLTDQSFALAYLKCAVTATSLDSCTKSTSPSCISTEAVGLSTCWNYTQGLLVGSYYMRLAPIGDTYSRVEVRTANAGSAWSTICFSCGTAYSVVSSTTASALCKMYGFGGVYSSAKAVSGGSGPVLISGLSCYSGATSLNYCTMDTTTVATATSGTGDDLGIRCDDGYTDYAASNGGASSSTNSNIGVIMGGVWGGIIGFVILVVIVSACIRGANSSSSSTATSSNTAMFSSGGGTTIHTMSNHNNNNNMNVGASSPQMSTMNNNNNNFNNRNNNNGMMMMTMMNNTNSPYPPAPPPTTGVYVAGGFGNMTAGPPQGYSGQYYGNNNINDSTAPPPGGYNFGAPTVYGSPYPPPPPPPPVAANTVGTGFPPPPPNFSGWEQQPPPPGFIPGFYQPGAV